MATAEVTTEPETATGAKTGAEDRSLTSLQPAADLTGQKQHIENLLQSANEAASSARTAWLGFLAILAYLLVTIASTTHVDLLLNRPITLPILDVDLPLFSFYGYAPLLLLLIHLGLLVQHAVVARKLHDLDAALDACGAAHEGMGSYIRGVRSRLTSYVFAQVLAGNERERGGLAVLMRIMLWAGLIVLPVLTLLAFQIAFLPYHDMSEWDGGLPRLGLTWWHRILLIADLGLLWALWPNIRQGNLGWLNAIRSYPRPVLIGNAVAASVGVLFSIFVATIPGETTDEWTAALPAFALSEPTRPGRQVFALTAWFFEGDVDDIERAPKSPFSRNLVIIGEDLVADKETWEEGERPLQLRRRDLRYANFSATDLKRSDLSFAKLQGAVLWNAQLQGAGLLLANLQGANLDGAQLQGAKLHGAQLQGAVLWNAQLQGADLYTAQLQGARLYGAQLQGASLLGAQLQGASLLGAQLQGASLSGAKLQGASLFSANLQGADLLYLQGAGADLVKLRGADLLSLQVAGAGLLSLQVAELLKFLGADLLSLQVAGAGFDEAQLEGADLREAHVWQATHPGTLDSLEFADLSGVQLEPPTSDERAELRQSVEYWVTDEVVRDRVLDSLSDILADDPPDWKDAQRWTPIAPLPIAPPANAVAEYLARLACGDQYVANGIVPNLMPRSDAVRYRFTQAFLAKEAENCPGRLVIDEGTLGRLRSFAEHPPDPIQ